MLFDTHWMLRRFRSAGYVVKKTRDTEGTTVWHVYYRPEGEENISRESLKYVGVVAGLNPQPLDIGSLTVCFGRPWFFLNAPEERESEQGKRAARIAQKSKRGGLHPR